MQFAPGQALTELSLSVDLGMSRTPVRDALAKLEQEGLVVSRNGRKRVHVLSIHEIREIFAVKRAIEGMIAGEAALKRSDFHVSRLSELLARMRSFTNRDFSDLTAEHTLLHDWLEMDKEFHGILFDAVGNERAKKMVVDLNSQWHRLELGILTMEDRLKADIDQHIELGQCVVGGESERARETMIRHLSEREGTIVGIMEAFKFPASAER
jgi:DNA-binding GntR family transcriptional regulator